MSRTLDDLSSACKPRAFELLARLVERSIHVLIVDTLRTPEEHVKHLASGASRTKFSRHLPRILREVNYPPSHPDAHKSDAIDLCPYEVFALHGPDKLQWDPRDPAWKIIGELGESLGFVWGGRWQAPHDPGHLELPPSIWRA